MGGELWGSRVDRPSFPDVECLCLLDMLGLSSSS